MASDMKKNIFRVTCSALLATLIIFPIAVFAYALLEPLPTEGGVYTELEEGYELTQYLEWLYKFALAAAAFLAVLMIVIGGIQMIVGGASETARSDGKKRIEQAIWGLLLAITAWLVLYSINPDLVKTGLTIPGITIEAPAETSGGDGQNMPPGLLTWPPGPPPGGTYSDADARTLLGLAGITINKADCVSANQTSCTSLYGLPESTVQSLKDLKNEVGHSFVITGGTEPGHQTHGPSEPIVDIRYDSSMVSSLNSFVSSGKISSYICENGSTVLSSCSPDSGADHFHVVFK